MDESQSSQATPPRRPSLESSTSTSEFEVVSREHSPSGSTVNGSTHSDNASVADVSGTTPNVSMQIPALYSESMHDDQEMPPLDHSIHLPQMNLESLSDTTMPHPSWSTKDDLMSLTTSVSQMSESCMSDISLMGKETVGMLEQLEKTVEQANEWRNRADKLEEQNRILQKSLKSSRNKVEQFTQEVEQLKQREEQLSLSLKQVEEHRSQSPSYSWYYRAFAMCVVVAAIAMYIDCYAQLLREHRSCEQLKEQLHLMNELVEKLEAEHAAEYKRRLDEISKQMADDMSASLEHAHRERELEHERLIEAYREKMLLHDDLTALRKEKFHGKRRTSTWYR